MKSEGTALAAQWLRALHGNWVQDRAGLEMLTAGPTSTSAQQMHFQHGDLWCFS